MQPLGVERFLLVREYKRRARGGWGQPASALCPVGGVLYPIWQNGARHLRQQKMSLPRCLATVGGGRASGSSVSPPEGEGSLWPTFLPGSLRRWQRVIALPPSLKETLLKPWPIGSPRPTGRSGPSGRGGPATVLRSPDLAEAGTRPRGSRHHARPPERQRDVATAAASPARVLQLIERHPSALARGLTGKGRPSWRGGGNWPA